MPILGSDREVPSPSGPHVHPSAPDTQTRLKTSEHLGRTAVTTTQAMSLIQPLVIPGHTADRTMTATGTDPPRPADRTLPAHLLHQAHLTVRRRARPRPNPSPARRRVALVQDARTQPVTPRHHAWGVPPVDLHRCALDHPEPRITLRRTSM